MKLLYYTRIALHEDIYAPKLADSLHLALVAEDGGCIPLFHNQGVAYAKAGWDENGELHAYSLSAPKICKEAGVWHILARRIEVDGTADPRSAGRLLHLTTGDFIHYREEALLMETDALARHWSPEQMAVSEGLALPEGCIPFGMIDIPDRAAEQLRLRFLTPVNVENRVPDQVTADSAEELADVRAVAVYSDGSTVHKRVDWYADGIDWNTPGTYTVEGRVHQDRYEFPIALHKADPAIARWNGKYYFISTNDQDGFHTIFIREADSIPGLVTAQEVCILDATMYPHLGNLLWAPELHIIEGRLYIFHAGTPQDFINEQSHVMALKPGGNPVKAADWEMPRRVERADGTMLYTGKGITLDMTVLRCGGKLCAVWSQRDYQDFDHGAWLMIAELDPQQPWRILTEPQALCVPEYGWENNHTFVCEGPFALYRDGRVMLTYSGAYVDASYVVSMLTIDEAADPLDLRNWSKENAPLLTSRSVPGEYGTGHNAYVTDKDGLVWNTYHAHPGMEGPRSSGIRRVHFGVNGHPHLDMTEEKDLAPALQWVKTKVIVK